MRTFCLALAGALVIALALPLEAQDAAVQFNQLCSGCHSIGAGQVVGPDLKNVTHRKDRAWLVRFMQNPAAVIDGGDAYAQQLKSAANGVVMPTLGLNATQANSLLDYIEQQSSASAGPGSAAPAELPFTPQDVTAGRAMFLGGQRLAHGGPACVSCHTLKDIGGLRGGRLGPDLTLVYEQLGGRRGLSGWLTAPASPTMAPIFSKHALEPQEIRPLVALFEAEAKTGGEDDGSARLNFLLLGLGGAVIGLVAMDSVWKRRLRGVRRALVAGANENNRRGER